MQDADATDALQSPSTNPAAGLTARGLRTRNALLQAGREEFEAVGFQDARVADITARANVSYGSFYTYFDTKDVLFHEIAESAISDMFRASRAPDVPSDEPLRRIETANRSYLNAYERNSRLMQLMEEVAPYDTHVRGLLRSVRRKFEQRIESGLRRMESVGQADSGVDLTLAAQILGGMVEQYGRNVFLEGLPYDEDAAVAALTRLWSQAIRLKG